MKPLVALLALLLLAASCSTGGSGDVSATLDEYSVKPDPARIESGETTFDVRNTGSIEHDFLVLATERDSDDLPVRRGSQVDTDARGIEVVGHIHSIGAGDMKTLTSDLEAGPYVLICNVAGHYSTGMHAEFEVS